MMKRMMMVMMLFAMLVNLVACGTNLDVPVVEEDVTTNEPVVDAETAPIYNYDFAMFKDIVSGAEDISVWMPNEYTDEDVAALVATQMEVDASIIHAAILNATKANEEATKYVINVEFIAHMDAAKLYVMHKNSYNIVLTNVGELESYDCNEDEDVKVQYTFNVEIMSNEAAAEAYDNGEENLLGAFDNGVMTETFEAVYNALNEEDVVEEEEEVVETPSVTTTPEPTTTTTPSENKGNTNNNTTTTPAPTNTPEPPVHTHTWTTKEVYHEGTGHYETKEETQEVIVGYDNTVTYACPRCSYSTTDYDAMHVHHVDTGHGGTIVNKKGNPIYGTQVVSSTTYWVEDTPGWTEYITTCPCGATK